MIRQASAWLPQRAPEPLPLQDLEQSDALRWVDIYGGDLSKGEVLALLDPICRGQLNEKMVRDLITPEAVRGRGELPQQRCAGSHPPFGFATAAPTQRKRAEGQRITSVFEPVQLLVGDDWLLSCWHPPRVFRGLSDPVHVADDSSSGLYLAVAKRWPTSNARTPRASPSSCGASCGGRRLSAADQLNAEASRPCGPQGGPHGSASSRRLGRLD